MASISGGTDSECTPSQTRRGARHVHARAASVSSRPACPAAALTRSGLPPLLSPPRRPAPGAALGREARHARRHSDAACVACRRPAGATVGGELRYDGDE
jgi:hypothetical protein